MSERVFVDTNVLVYAHDRGAGERHERARELVAQLWRDRAGVLSTQVIQELFVNIRRKANKPLSESEARRVVEDYLRWSVVTNRGETILGALDVLDRYHLSFWDALIVQAAKESGVERLYSEDLGDGQWYDTVRVENPFR